MLRSPSPNMTNPMTHLLTTWHRLLALPRHPRVWYRARFHEELAELRCARTWLERLSESADVLYILSRAAHDGHQHHHTPHHRHRFPHHHDHDRDGSGNYIHDRHYLFRPREHALTRRPLSTTFLPLFEPRFTHTGVYLYMVAKYTLRWGFYRVLARMSGGTARGGSGVGVREVVNPAKDWKLAAVAARYGFEAERFTRNGRWLRRVWPLLP